MDTNEIAFPESATVSDIRDTLNLTRFKFHIENSGIVTSGTKGTIVLHAEADGQVGRLSMPQGYAFHFWRLEAEIKFLLERFSRNKEHKCAALYLVQVLANAIQEIRAAQPCMSYTWRSPTLHPVLWRSYLGFQHSDSHRISCRDHCAANSIDLQDDPLLLSELFLNFGICSHLIFNIL